MSISAVRVNRATRQVLYRGSYPRVDGEPVSPYGFYDSGEEEWLIVNEPVERGNVIIDPRYYTIITNENAATGLEHPLYPGVGQFLVTYTTPKLPIEDILINLETAENNANVQAMPEEKHLKYILIALNAIRKLAQGIPLQAYEETVLTKVNDYTNAIINNYQNAKSMENAIQNNLEPDLDSGWQTEIS